MAACSQVLLNSLIVCFSLLSVSLQPATTAGPVRADQSRLHGDTHSAGEMGDVGDAQYIEQNANESDINLYQWEDALLRTIFSKDTYNTDVRPAVNLTEPVYVSLELVLLQINDLDWEDERLTWSPADFGGIEWLVSAAPNVWLPDIALINSDDVYAITRDGRFPVTITSNGRILFVPAGKIHARCELDLRYFPFDEQLCIYRFESWVYAAELVKIVGVNFTIDKNHYIGNHQWEIRDSFVQTRIVHYETYNFSRVEFYMLLRRKSLFFITYTIFPCLALSTLQIFSHMLPFTESERINFATTTLIAFSVFHVSIVEQMPQSSHAIPLLAIYIDALMCLIGFSLLECFFLMNWLSKVGCNVPSPVLWYYVVDRWGDYFFLGSNGIHWRRNYLRILEQVSAREAAEYQRRSTQRKRWTTASRREQEKFIKKWNSISNRYQSPGDTNALVELMNKYGCSFTASEQLQKLKNRRNVLKHADMSSIDESCTENNCQYGSMYSRQTAEGIQMDADCCFPFIDTSSLSSTPCHKTSPARKSSDKYSPHHRFQAKVSPVGSPEQAKRMASQSSSEQSEQITVIFDPTTQECETKLSTDAQVLTEVPVRTQARADNEQAEQTRALEEIRGLVEDVNITISSHTLRRECIGVWTVFITVVDRVMSLVLMIVCIVMPTYLFIFFPEAMDLTTVKRNRADS